MLLFIALVNAQFFLTHVDTIQGGVDQILLFVQRTLVNGRAIPLFSLLFGYGTAWILRRTMDAGGEWADARAVLRRRGFWMLLIGLVHGVVFLPVDIVGAYGLGLLLFVGFLRASDRVLLWSAGGFAVVSTVALVVLTLADAASATSETPEEAAAAAPSLVEGSFLAASTQRLGEWTLYTPVTLLMTVMPPLLVGMWAGRRQILERPNDHRTLLTWTGTVGIATAIVGGVPVALVGAGLVPAPSPVLEGMLWVVHDLSGWVGGAGWTALIALSTMWLTRRTDDETDASPASSTGPVTSAIAAVGERSLSCYLFQSVVFTIVFAPYGLGLGAHATAATAVVVAVTTWSASVLLAEVQRRHNRRGPAEVLLRTLVYGRRSHANR
ncbi:DUF418 domain-containing protein [Spiractinospora alimapuensis]|nr:DUF418 domain-containing protein [Spiractinospora alimapuensis]